jgi:hypothetical protein
MHDDLFFIPMIAEALRRPDQKAALRVAFTRIQAMRHDPCFGVGYQQFLRFMHAAYEARSHDESYEASVRIPEELDRSSTLVLTLERDGTVMATCTFERTSSVQTVRDIRPGYWQLKTDTGRVMWEDLLTADDVIWAESHPGRDLPLAAGTGESTRQATREIALLGGTVVLRVCPGVDCGVLEIILKTLESTA